MLQGAVGANSADDGMWEGGLSFRILTVFENLNRADIREYSGGVSKPLLDSRLFLYVPPLAGSGREGVGWLNEMLSVILARFKWWWWWCGGLC